MPDARPPWPLRSLKFVSIPLSIALKRSPIPRYALGDISTASTYSVLSSRWVDWFSRDSMYSRQDSFSISFFTRRSFIQLIDRGWRTYKLNWRQWYQKKIKSSALYRKKKYLSKKRFRIFPESWRFSENCRYFEKDHLSPVYPNTTPIDCLPGTFAYQFSISINFGSFTLFRHNSRHLLRPGVLIDRICTSDCKWRWVWFLWRSHR